MTHEWLQLSWAFDDHGLGDAGGTVEAAVRASLAHVAATMLATLHSIIRQLSKAKYDALLVGGFAASSTSARAPIPVDEQVLSLLHPCGERKSFPHVGAAVEAVRRAAWAGRCWSCR